MNAWSTLSVAILLALAAIAGVPASAQDGEPGQGQSGEGAGGEGGQSANATGPGNSGDAQARRDCQERYRSGDQNVSDPEHPCHRFYVNSGSGSSDNRGKAERLDRYQSEYEEVHKPRQSGAPPGKLPDAVGFRIEPTGYEGRFVSFVPNLADWTVSDFTFENLRIIDAIETPGPLDGEPRLGRTFFEARGADWELRVNDNRRVVSFDTDAEAPFVITFPEGATVAWDAKWVTITYPSTGQKATTARLAGALEPDPTLDVDNATGGAKIIVVGDAAFQVLVPPASGQGAFPVQYDDAVLEGAVGAEMNVHRGAHATEVLAETTTFGDLEIAFESSDDATIDGAQSQLYTITVDSPTHDGKTIAVTIESGLIDPSALVFRYFNVNENETVQASIVRASSLDDVLDPLDDGVVAEYWVVEDLHGVHALISIPHFSIHKIEMQNLGQVIVEQPSIVLGVLGAVLVVGVATRAMFRRPRE